MTRREILLELLLFTAVRPTKYWKGWVHTHTRFSDGELTPLELVYRARQSGVQFVCTLDHYLGKDRPGIPSKTKQINGEPAPVGDEFVGMENYLKTWEELTGKTGIVFVPGVEYTFAKSHLGVVNITLDLHNQIAAVFDGPGDEETKIRQILALVRGSDALPLICHPTLKMTHPKNWKKPAGEFVTTDYSFDPRLWRNEPFLLVEFLNHGNLDTPDQLTDIVSARRQKTVVVAGVDFHTDSAQFLGIHGSREFLGLNVYYPKSLSRFTWVKASGSKCTLPAVVAALRQGDTYLTYGHKRIDPLIDSGWKRVTVDGLSFVVPKDWYEDGPAPRDPRLGYSGEDSAGNFMSVAVERSPEDGIKFSPEAYDDFKIISQSKRLVNGFQVETTDIVATPAFGSNSDISHRYRRIAVWKNSARGIRVVTIEGEARHFNRQKELFNKISSSLQMEK